MKEYLQIKVITDFDEKLFTERVNDFLEYLGRRVKDIQYQYTSKNVHSVIITYWC